MANHVFHTILVAGDNHEEIIKKYDAETKVAPYLYIERSTVGDRKKKYIQTLTEMLSPEYDNLKTYDGLTVKTPNEYLQNMKTLLENISDDLFFNSISMDCTIDEKGDAYSTKNPNGYYLYPFCPQTRFKKDGEEGHFSIPFTLVDGTQSYSAKKGEIDWNIMHMNNTHLYERVWEMVVEDSEPQDEEEEALFNSMHNRIKYFENFADKEAYVNHSCSFWCYGFATEKSFNELDFHTKDTDWVKNFYRDYIEPLDDDTLLTIYEVKSME